MPLARHPSRTSYVNGSQVLSDTILTLEEKQNEGALYASPKTNSQGTSPMKTFFKKFSHSSWLADRLPFYYGWAMLPISTIALAATAPGQTFGISVFNPSFRQSLRLSHSQLTGAYMFGTLFAAPFQPFVGALMDRFGIRKVMVSVVVLLGLSCVYVAQVQSLWMLFVGFWLLRLFGQGSLNLLAGNIPAMWFQRRLGLASSIVNIGFAISNAVFPPFFLWMILQYGWRNAYTLLGALVCVVLLPLLALFLRDRPEDVNQRLDGGLVASDSAKGSSDPTRPSLNLKEAQKTRSYWIMLVFVGLWSMIVTAIYFNIIPVLTNQGLTASQGATTFSTLAIASVITQLIAGPLADRAPLNWMLFAGLGSLISALLVLNQANSLWLAHVYAVLMGVTQGMLGVASSTLWARYYGRAHLGKIRGSMFTATVAGSSAGPFIMGFLFDQLDSYQLSLLIFIGLLIPLTLATLWATPPRTQH